ncbi:Uncharacterised protein [uncultured archaeon]|nr:Uncharacterised protein [uncultured archaeon]
MLQKKAKKAQAAIDFMMSYGIALVIITVAVSVIYETSILIPSLTSSSCTPSPGFSCDTFALNRTGILNISLSQATGGAVVVQGVACSTQINGSGIGPKYGNFYVTGNALWYPAVTINSVLTNTAPNSLLLYSGSGTLLRLNCYGAGGIAKGSPGSSFIGYIWLNYSVPGYGSTTQQVASLSLVYT